MSIKFTLPQKAYRVKIDFNHMKGIVEIVVFVNKWSDYIIGANMPEYVPKVRKKIRLTIDEFNSIDDENYIDDLIEKTANELYDSKL